MQVSVCERDSCEDTSLRESLIHICWVRISLKPDKSRRVCVPKALPTAPLTHNCHRFRAKTHRAKSQKSQKHSEFCQCVEYYYSIHCKQQHACKEPLDCSVKRCQFHQTLQIPLVADPSQPSGRDTTLLSETLSQWFSIRGQEHVYKIT